MTKTTNQQYHYCYELEDQIFIDGSTYQSYAVIVKENGSPVRLISDVFLNLKDAITFTACCNEEQLDPLHLDNVIEDVLAAGHC